MVLPDGTLVNVFNEILNFKNSDKGAKFEFNLSLIRSTDKGATWTRGQPIRAAKMQTLALFRTFGIVDPDTPADGVRTQDLIPQITVDRSVGSPGHGNLYAVWQDARFSGFSHDEIAFSRSTDGGFTWSPRSRSTRRRPTLRQATGRPSRRRFAPPRTARSA